MGGFRRHRRQPAPGLLATQRGRRLRRGQSLLFPRRGCAGSDGPLHARHRGHRQPSPTRLSSPQEAEFSLAGLTAALIWIDEQQGRLGSERVASAAPYGLAPVYAGETAAPDIPLALLDRHRADPDCEPLEELANGRDIVVDELDGGYTLYLLPCQSGAYNFGQKVYLGAGGDYFDPQFFADYQAGIGWTGTPYLWNADYDPATKSISTFAKARGVGDCGTHRPVAVERLSLPARWRCASRDCSDDIDPDAEMPEFPIVYTGEPLPPATP